MSGSEPGGSVLALIQARNRVTRAVLAIQLAAVEDGPDLGTEERYEELAGASRALAEADDALKAVLREAEEKNPVLAGYARAIAATGRVP